MLLLLNRLTLVCLFLLLFAGCKTSTARVIKDVVLTHVNIVDPLNQRVIPDQHIRMSQGVIQSVTPAKEPINAEDAIVIEGHGGYVTPGLIDMHTHIYDEAATAISLSHGVVHMRVLNGMPQLLNWREKLKNGELWGSTLSVSSPIITGNPKDVLRSYVETGLEAQKAVDDAFEAGYDLIKVYNSLPREHLSAVIKRADELGIPIAQHGPHPPEGMPWSRLSGIQTFEHVEDIFQGPLAFKQDSDRLEETLSELALLNVPIVPTLAIFEQLTKISIEKEAFLGTVSTDYIPPIVRSIETKDQVKRWLNSSAERAELNRTELDYLTQITREVKKKGIPILVGSDAGTLLLPYGIGTHKEMALLAQSGLSNFDVLHAATSAPAAVLGLSAELGQIKIGARADFIYTQTNPVKDLGVLENPDAMIRQGLWYSAELLTQQRDKAMNKRSLLKEIWLLLTNY